jgi:HEPN domain-containing protein
MPAPRAFWPRRWIGLAGLALGLLVAGSPRPAAAQDCLRARQEVEATQPHLERAREVVEQGGNPRAFEPLRLAFRLQEQAVALLGEPSLRSCLHAIELTREARRLADRAMSVAAQQAEIEQRALNEIQQVERILENVRDRAAGPLPDRVHRFLSMAERRLEQARQAYHEQRFEEALNIARDLRRLLEDVGRNVPQGRPEQALENTRRLLDSAREQVEEAGNDEARSLLERAEQQFELARTSLEAGHPLVAERQMQQARDLALRAMRQAEGEPDAARLDVLLEETSAYVNEVAREVREAGLPEPTTLIENALRHMDRALQLRRENRLQQSLDEARVARNLARRAAELTDRSGL